MGRVTRRWIRVCSEKCNLDVVAIAMATSGSAGTSRSIVRYYCGASAAGDREQGLGDTLTAEFHGWRSLARGYVCRIA